MPWTVLIAVLQYGVPAVGALYSFLAHRKAKQIHQDMTQMQGGPPK
jgi:hypothetical protein